MCTPAKLGLHPRKAREECDGHFHVSAWLGQRLPRRLVKLWGSLGRKWAFGSVDWVSMALLAVGEDRPIHGGLNRTKGPSRGGWGPPSPRGCLNRTNRKRSAGLTLPLPDCSAGHRPEPTAPALGLSNCSTSLPGLPACRWQVWDVSAAILRSRSLLLLSHWFCFYEEL